MVQYECNLNYSTWRPVNIEMQIQNILTVQAFFFVITKLTSIKRDHIVLLVLKTDDKYLSFLPLIFGVLIFCPYTSCLTFAHV